MEASGISLGDMTTEEFEIDRVHLGRS
jgi:hypothetical protein